MKLLLIDLDDTLIDTSTHKSHVFDQIAQKIGVSITDIENVYEQQKKLGHIDGWISEHEQILDAVIPEIKINSPVLNYLKNSDAYKVIFSFGDIKYQNKKIDILKLRKEVNYVIITPKYKLNYLSSIINENHVTLNNKEYTDVTLIDNDETLLLRIKNQYPWIKGINPSDLV